ncbi:MAG: 16S rRNA (cytosine(1402)-N(4))-methyltransferase RsmH [Candidatus Nomurabacteria bacterium]|nr:16S rRNA (cytosine(1402)-N(4))-methyltransferase RsmH [Candidatus Nomurabacteria bacterium]
MKTNIHIPVLSAEVIDSLDLDPNDTVVDATLGGAGHALQITDKLGSDGHFIGIDTDPLAIKFGEDVLSDAKCSVDLVRANFRDISKILDSLQIKNADKILMDLGWSSNQIEDPERGFSFMADGPLDMRLNPDAEISAHTVVNEWGEDTIADILYGFSDERFSRPIARNIVEAREQVEITTTGQLAEIVANSIPKRFHPKRLHPATKTFQAIRMAVNDELGALKQGMTDGFVKLSANGIMSIITFHSTEDRAVKNYFRSLKQSGAGELINKKPITASETELLNNQRARSAKLRAIKKL